MNDAHGLSVYEQRPGIKFVSADAQLTLQRNASAFDNAFRESLCTGVALRGKLLFAFELYGASHFLAVPSAAHSAALQRARFLTLWTALELLRDLLPDEETRRSDEAVQMLQRVCERDQKLRATRGRTAIHAGGLGLVAAEIPEKAIPDTC